MVARVRALVDCDVHCAPASIGDLEPYLSDYWRRYVESAAVRLTGLPSFYPPGARTSATPEAGAGDGPAVPATFEALAERVLEPERPRYVVLTCLTLCEAYRNPYYQAAMASALNDWLRERWLDRDERLRASMLVPTADIGAAVAEIERLAGDTRFVQVLLPVRADAPYGNRRYHPLFEAAAAHGLAVGLHAWGLLGHAPSSSGFTLTYTEDYLANAQIAQVHVLSLVSEGVFERFPKLRVALLECGFAWLPPLLWRFDKDWRGLWHEVPWVKEKPSQYVKRHLRASTAPAHLPKNPHHARELLAMVGAEWLMYASDYPHDHGPSERLLLEALGQDDRRAVLGENAARFYGLRLG